MKNEERYSIWRYCALFFVASWSYRFLLALLADRFHNQIRKDMVRAALSLVHTGVLGNLCLTPTGPSALQAAWLCVSARRAVFHFRDRRRGRDRQSHPVHHGFEPPLRPRPLVGVSFRPRQTDYDRGRHRIHAVDRRAGDRASGRLGRAHHRQPPTHSDLPALCEAACRRDSLAGGQPGLALGDRGAFQSHGFAGLRRSPDSQCPARIPRL